MPKKKKQEPTGSVAASATLGIILLSANSVDEVREMPNDEEVKKHTVYFVAGKDRGGSYRAREQAFLAGQSGMIRLEEEDLNGWAGNTFKFGKPKPGEEPTGGVIHLMPASPNFRIRDGEFQIGLPVEVETPFVDRKMRFFARGSFVRRGDAFAFQPEIAYLGSAQLPPGVAELVINSLMSPFRSTEAFPPLKESWDGLSDVRVEGDELILIRQ